MAPTLESTLMRRYGLKYRDTRNLVEEGRVRLGMKRFDNSPELEAVCCQMIEDAKHGGVSKEQPKEKEDISRADPLTSQELPVQLDMMDHHSGNGSTDHHSGGSAQMKDLSELTEDPDLLTEADHHYHQEETGVVLDTLMVDTFEPSGIIDPDLVTEADHNVQEEEETGVVLDTTVDTYTDFLTEANHLIVQQEETGVVLDTTVDANTDDEPTSGIVIDSCVLKADTTLEETQSIRTLQSLLPHTQLFSETTLHRVQDWHEHIANTVTMDWNDLVLLLLASITSGAGFITNYSSCTIHACCVLLAVTPFWGPIRGTAYSATIRDFHLLYEALFNVCTCVAFAILVGVVLGAAVGTTEWADDWPTESMLQAPGTSWHHVLIGALVATGSGLAIGLDPTSSRVGGAMTMSLLPPAVNAGLLWMACVLYDFNRLGSDHGPYRRSNMAVSSSWWTWTTATSLDNTDDSYFTDSFWGYCSWDTVESIQSYFGWSRPSAPPVYSRSDLQILGGFSLLSVVTNLTMIILASILMFGIQQQLDDSLFWKDLSVARKHYDRKRRRQLARAQQRARKSHSV